MIPVTHPTFTNPFNGFGDCKVSYLSSVSGLAAWTDYIPVITVVASTSIEGRTEANGYQNVHPVGATGNVAWTDYIPVYEDATKTVPWSTDANGYIPVGMSEDGVLGFLSQAEFQANLTHSLVLDAGTGSPTFTRATVETGQKWDEAGYLDFTALAGEAVFKGARRERNFVSTVSQDFSNAAWTKLSTTVVVNQAIAPDGTLTADLVHPASTGADRVVYQNGLVSLVIGNTALLVVRAKYAGIRWLWFGTLGGGTAPAQLPFFDLQNGVVGQAGTYFDAVSMEDLGDGWYECAATKNSLPVAPLFPIYGLGDADGSTTVTANGTDGFYLWASQINDITGETDQTTIRPYVSVGVESAPAYHGSMVDGVKCFPTDRSGNPISTSGSYPLVGYVPWEARTNLQTYSNDLRNTAEAGGARPWTETGTGTCGQTAIGPDGTTSAWVLNDTGGAALYLRSGGNVAVSASVAYTTSVFVKKAATLTVAPLIEIKYTGGVTTYIQQVLNPVSGTVVSLTGSTAPTQVVVSSHNADYWRVSITATSPASTNVALISLYPAINTDASATLSTAAQGANTFYGVDIQLGAFATPYIPTTTVAVARNADLLTYTGADVANIKTLACQVTDAAFSGAGKRFVQLDDGTESNRVQLAYSTPTVNMAVVAGGVAQAVITGTASSDMNMSCAVATNSFLFDVNRTAGTPDVAGSLPVVSVLRVGTTSLGAESANAGVNHIYGWTRNLSQSELNAIT